VILILYIAAEKELLDVNLRRPEIGVEISHIRRERLKRGLFEDKDQGQAGKEVNKEPGTEVETGDLWLAEDHRSFTVDTCDETHEDVYCEDHIDSKIDVRGLLVS
jgi:hypothetical protein